MFEGTKMIARLWILETMERGMRLQRKKDRYSRPLFRGVFERCGDKEVDPFQNQTYRPFVEDFKLKLEA